MIRRRQPLRIFISALAILSLVGVSPLQAATRTWDGGVADDANWTTSTNWSTDVAPVAGDDLIFTGTNDLSTNNDFAADSIFNSITFDASAGVFTLGGNTITLGTPTPFGSTGSGNITNSAAANSQTIGLNIKLGAGNHTINGGTGGIALNVPSGTLKAVSAVGTGGTAVFQNTVTSTTINNVGSTNVLGGYATVGTAWAARNGGAISAYVHINGGANNETFAAATAIPDNTNLNIKITTTGGANTLAATPTTNINTLLFDTAVINQTINIGATQTLRLGQFGGIFRTNSASNGNTNFIGNAAGQGSLTAGGGAVDVAGEIVLNGGAGTGTGTQMTVNANIVNNGTGLVTLIKTGRGYASLAGTSNNYGGGTFINEGRLQAGTAESAGNRAHHGAGGRRSVYWKRHVDQ